MFSIASYAFLIGFAVLQDKMIDTAKVPFVPISDFRKNVSIHYVNEKSISSKSIDIPSDEIDIEHFDSKSLLLMMIMIMTMTVKTE